MSRNEDQGLVVHLEGLLEKAKASGGSVVVELPEHEGERFVLRGLQHDGELGVILKYTAQNGAWCGAEVTAQGRDGVRIEADGITGRDVYGNTIGVRIETQEQA